MTIHGTVVSTGGQPVANALVTLQSSGTAKPVAMQTDTQGAFTFGPLATGQYRVVAEKAGLHSQTATVVDANGPDRGILLLTLNSTAPAAAQAMEFSDQPNFTVAGVTDWTAVGGHGSDATLRTSEDLARETAALKAQNADQGATALPGSNDADEGRLRAALATTPGSFEANRQLGMFYLRQARYKEAAPFLQAAWKINPQDAANERDLAVADRENGDLAKARQHLQTLLARDGSATMHSELAELDEQSGDPLSAVHEEEQAVRLEPSEANYFAWGSELLLHRAVWQAVEVFRKGNQLHPNSPRMLTALGASLFAGDLFDEAAEHLCRAADLQPAEESPYRFLGRVAIAAPHPLPCVESRLARFAQQQPQNVTANYLYAMAILKRQERTPDPASVEQAQSLLRRAVTIDPRCADAWLQLGILAAAQHHPEEAISDYSRAIEADPQSGEAHYRLGVAYDRSGAAEKARQEFQLHDEIEKLRAAIVERQRHEVKQFLVILGNQPVPSQAH